MSTVTKTRTTRRKPPQFIVDEKGRRTGVVLTVRQYQAMLQRIEDLKSWHEANPCVRSEAGSGVRSNTRLQARRLRSQVP